MKKETINYGSIAFVHTAVKRFNEFEKKYSVTFFANVLDILQSVKTKWFKFELKAFFKLANITNNHLKHYIYDTIEVV